MVKKPVGWVALGIFTLGTTHAWAQEQTSATGSVGVSTDSGAQAAATSDSATSNAATSNAATSDTATFEPYEAGYPPDNNLLELGVFGGVFFPAKKHNLRNEEFRQRSFRAGPRAVP